MKTLIAYFSKTGITRKAANRLHDITDGKLFEIKSEKDYGDYFTALRIARKEFAENEFPQVLNKVNDFASYERILIGFPIWHNKCPRIVLSFVSQYDFTGKEVYPFCTSEMSEPESAVEMLAETCQGANIHRGFLVNKADDGMIKKWLG